MTIYNIHISAEGDSCDECPFLDSSYLNITAKCLLFNEPLAGVMEYGHVESWERCDKCYSVCRKIRLEVSDESQESD